MKSISTRMIKFTTATNMVLREVQTISKHTIKPSSPTPPHLHSVQLSSLDQTAPQIFTHLLLFYTSSPDQTTTNLKTSLTQTLTHFYPLAGRIQLSKSTNTLCVDCNDQGVEFVESRTEADLASFLLDPPIDRFNELLPIKVTEFRWVEDPLLAVQLTRFAADGGLALGVSVSHLIADGASISSFLSCWSGIARGMDPDSSVAPCRFDSASVFPPRPSLSDRTLPDPKCEDVNRGVATTIRRFSIGKRSMERLRRGTATRVEAVSALVWRCLDRVRGKPGQLSHVVNIRGKLSPPLPAGIVGNLMVSVVASGGASRAQEEREGAIRRAVRNVDEGYVRRREVGGWAGEGEVSWIFSSWCRMGWYRNDFGWGEPVWFGCGISDMKDVCILIDAKNGDGMEVWLWLERVEMERVERDTEFLDYVLG